MKLTILLPLWIRHFVIIKPNFILLHIHCMCKTQNIKMTGKLLVLADTNSRSLVNKLCYNSARHGCNAYVYIKCFEDNET